jgi:RimJ/RimL family protein N-acetyltransferase
MAVTRPQSFSPVMPAHRLETPHLREIISNTRSMLGLRRPRFLRGPRLPKPAVAPIVATERLRLRPHEMKDARDWLQIQSNPDVVRYLDWPVRNAVESRRHLKHRTRHTVLLQADDFLALAVEREGQVIGDVSLHLRDVHSKIVEMGWVLNPAHGRHGYATEAAAALAIFAFEHLGACEITAVIHEKNERSIALAKRLGFVGDPQRMLLTRERFDSRPALAYLTDETERVTTGQIPIVWPQPIAE